MLSKMLDLEEFIFRLIENLFDCCGPSILCLYSKFQHIGATGTMYFGSPSIFNILEGFVFMYEIIKIN